MISHRTIGKRLRTAQIHYKIFIKNLSEYPEYLHCASESYYLKTVLQIAF